jgi:hypothetical protein
MKIRIWHLAVFIVALVAFAVAFAPAAIFVPQRPGALTYERAEGSVWNARFQRVRIGPYSADSASMRLSPFDVVQGKAIVPVELRDGTIEGSLMLLGNWHGDRRLAAQNLRLQGISLGRLQAEGEVLFRGLDVLFEDGVCTRAQGRVETDALVRAGGSLNWSGPPLVGSASCDGDDARILLSGANELGERVNLRANLRSDGAASWRLSVQGARPQTEAALVAAGFTRGVADGALGYGEDLRWWP